MHEGGVQSVILTSVAVAVSGPSIGIVCAGNLCDL